MPWTVEQMRELFDFLRWGDIQMLQAAATVPEVEYLRERGISIGSIHKVLLHSMAVEWLWLQRWEGKSPARIENETNHPSLAALEERWPVIHLALTQFLDQQDLDSLAANVQYQNMRGEAMSNTLSDLMIHLVDHGTYHRGQINSMIKMGGGKPAAVGYHIFTQEKLKKRI